jgi:hypothetical protein
MARWTGAFRDLCCSYALHAAAWCEQMILARHPNGGGSGILLQRASFSLGLAAAAGEKLRSQVVTWRTRRRRQSRILGVAILCVF